MAIWKDVQEAASAALQARNDKDERSIPGLDAVLKAKWLESHGEPPISRAERDRTTNAIAQAAAGERDALLEIWPVMSGVSLRDAASLPMSPPVIKHRRERGAVLVEGEVALLVGEGKVGKSSISIGLALAAASANEKGQPWGTACGLDVRCGPVVLASWEDRAPVVGHRAAQWVAAATAGKGRVDILGIRDGNRDPAEPIEGSVLAKALNAVPVVDMRPFGHLFAPPANTLGQALTNALPRESAAFRRLWALVDRVAPDGGALLVVDPAGKAFAGDPNSLVQVQSFLTALAVAAGERGAAVLLVHHSNKAARGKKGGTADAASGAAAWTDGARGVVGLKQVPQSKDLELKCLAANYGSAWWKETLRRDGKSSVLRRAERTAAKPVQRTPVRRTGAT